MNDIEKEIVNELVERYGRGTNDDDVLLTDDEMLSLPINSIGLDSLDFLELVFELEEKYNVELEEISVTAFPTVGSVVEVIKKKLEQD